MSAQITYSVDQASELEIAMHLDACDSAFIPQLSARIDIASYAEKISTKATRFEAWSNQQLVGLVAIYCDLVKDRVAFITNVSSIPYWQGRGIASILLGNAVSHVCALGYARIDLEVDHRNVAALRLYAKHGFAFGADHPTNMMLYLKTNSI